jgi:peptidyl-prolyl cis-trans isomerase C
VRKKIVVIVGLIIGLSIIALSTIQSTSDINEDVIIVNNKNLEVFYFNNLDPENPYNQDFSILSDKQINQLKKEFIQREVLVREAKRLGLDKIDSIISARLAQLGQQALVGEIIEFEDIELSEINDFFETNKSQYIEPETISFSHIFFDTEESAKSYLLKLQKESDVEKLKRLINIGGIVFPYQKNYSKKPFPFIVGHFGEIGATNLFSLQKDIKNWQGPIRSSLGYHLVNVFNRAPMKQMALEDILSAVKRDYYDQLRKKDSKNIISNKILEYEIIDETKVN